MGNLLIIPVFFDGLIADRNAVAQAAHEQFKILHFLSAPFRFQGLI
jgi:hypothetical protein